MFFQQLIYYPSENKYQSPIKLILLYPLLLHRHSQSPLPKSISFDSSSDLQLMEYTPRTSFLSGHQFSFRIPPLQFLTFGQLSELEVVGCPDTICPSDSSHAFPLVNEDSLAMHGL